MLDSKDTEIKNLNQQLKEQYDEDKKLRQILDTQTVEYARDKQKLVHHEKTIEENKKLQESQEKKINGKLLYFKTSIK